MRADSGSRTVGRVLRLLDLIVASPEPQRLVDIIREVDIPPSSVHLLLKELSRARMVQISDDKRYSAGPALVSLALQVVSRERIIDIATPAMTALAERAGEDVILALPKDNSLIFVHRVRAPNRPGLSIDLGRPQLLHTTAGGQLYLATMPRAERDAMLDTLSWDRLTDQTITDRTELEHRLDITAERGWGMTDREALPFVVTLAGPIYSRERRFVATLSIPVITDQSPARLDELRVMLLEVCDQLSHQLSGDSLTVT